MTRRVPAKSRSTAKKRGEVIYPESDGKPMGETGLHVKCIIELMTALDLLFSMVRGRDDVHLAADMFLYYEEGNPKANKSPDVMVTFGIDSPGPQRTFKTWVERTAPQVIFEITSAKTWRVDVHEKPVVYASIGVEEYYIFDPLDERLKPRFQGFLLVDGAYRPMPFEPDGSIVSPRLEIRIVPEGYRLRLIRLENGESLPMISEWQRSHEELKRQSERSAEDRNRAILIAEEESRRAEEESRRANELTLRLEEESRRAEEESLRAEEESLRAEEESRRANELAIRLDEESRKLKTLEAEIARLRASLEEQ